MSSHFSVSFPAPVNATGILIPFNTGNQSLGFQVSGVDPTIELQPGELIKYMIKPTGLALTDTQISGILNGQTVDDESTGQFFTYIHNTTELTKRYEFPKFIFPSAWENTEFTLHWLQTNNGQSFSHYGAYTTPVYSYPHNIQPNEVQISGVVGPTEKTIDYSIFFKPLVNEGSTDYAGGDDLPYTIYVEHSTPDNSTPYNLTVDGFESGWKFYPSGAALSGITFTVPFYDNRDGSEIIPAKYTFNINYNSAGPDQPGSIPLQVNIDHEQLKDSFFADLTALASSSPKIENLHEVNNITIPAGVISRKRLAIGIEDIKSLERVFEKTGVYVSNAFNLDFSIYTFSIKAEEYKQIYPNCIKKFTIKY